MLEPQLLGTSGESGASPPGCILPAVLALFAKLLHFLTYIGRYFCSVMLV
jgi:hypothetical protein